MNNENTKNLKLYECEECGLHYKSEAIKEKCREWCSKHKSCNLEITKYSIESQRIRK
jgi:predicted Zn-ribbon and HTH transcriptional regulator